MGLGGWEEFFVFLGGRKEYNSVPGEHIHNDLLGRPDGVRYT